MNIENEGWINSHNKDEEDFLKNKITEVSEGQSEKIHTRKEITSDILEDIKIFTDKIDMVDEYVQPYVLKNPLENVEIHSFHNLVAETQRIHDELVTAMNTYLQLSKHDLIVTDHQIDEGCEEFKSSSIALLILMRKIIDIIHAQKEIPYEIGNTWNMRKIEMSAALAKIAFEMENQDPLIQPVVPN